jgi:hypothetical protein
MQYEEGTRNVEWPTDWNIKKPVGEARYGSTQLIPALWRLRQEDWEYEVCLVYIVSSSPAWSI